MCFFRVKAQYVLKLLGLFIFFLSSPAIANNKLHIATAANFYNVLNDIAEKFSQENNIDIIITSASTGKL